MKKQSFLVEEVRHLPKIMSFGKRGKMNIQEAVNMVAETYRLSSEAKDYSFIVLKALHSDEPNANGDAFPLEELERYSSTYDCKVYETFIGKPHFIEHRQDGEPYGFVLDAHLEKDDDSSFVELVIAVDTTKDTLYGDLVKAGKVDKFSMGCTVGTTICSICKNEASDARNFCDHIKKHKMEIFADEESGEETLSYESCYDLVFDEISAVADPADRGAIKQEELKAAARKRRLANRRKAKRKFTGSKKPTKKKAIDMVHIVDTDGKEWTYTGKGIDVIKQEIEMGQVQPAKEVPEEDLEDVAPPKEEIVDQSMTEPKESRRRHKGKRVRINHRKLRQIANKIRKAQEGEEYTLHYDVEDKDGLLQNKDKSFKDPEKRDEWLEKEEIKDDFNSVTLRIDPAELAKEDRLARRKSNTPDKHQLKVLKQVLKAPDAMVPMMGGGFNNKEEVRQILRDKFNYTEEQIKKLEASRKQSKKRISKLVKKYREDKDRKEWALVSKSDSDKVLKWFGTKKPSKDAVAKEEARVQYFKNQGKKKKADDSFMLQYGYDKPGFLDAVGVDGSEGNKLWLSFINYVKSYPEDERDEAIEGWMAERLPEKYAKKRHNKISKKKGLRRTAAEVAEIANQTIEKKKASEDDLEKNFIQYIKQKNTYFPTGEVVLKSSLESRPYEVSNTMSGIQFEAVKPLTDELLTFDDSPMNNVVKEVDRFWDSKEAYDKLGLTHNRGILLYGPPGTGKSIALQQTADLMAKRGEVVFFVKDPSDIIAGLRAFRQVEPNRKVVIAFEEADEMCQWNEREMLRIMDGDAKVAGILFLATTNYIEKLPERMLRPGRFDHKVYVGFPKYEHRHKYLTHKLQGIEADQEKIASLAERTDGLGFGHLRELLAGVYAIGDPVDKVFEKLHFKVDSLERVARKNKRLAKKAQEMDGDKEEGWLRNLSQDVDDGEVLDEFTANEWFEERYNRPADIEETEDMRSIFSKRIAQEDPSMGSLYTKLTTKPTNWDDIKDINVSSDEKEYLDNLPEFDFAEVFAGEDKSVFADFVSDMPEWFITDGPDGRNYVVDTGGYDYARHIGRLPEGWRHLPSEFSASKRTAQEFTNEEMAVLDGMAKYYNDGSSNSPQEKKEYLKLTSEFGVDPYKLTNKVKNDELWYELGDIMETGFIASKKKKSKNWDLVINLGDVWPDMDEMEFLEDDSDTFETVRDQIVEKLKSYYPQVSALDDTGEYENLVEELTYAPDLEEFNYEWDNLYDWADYNNIFIETMRTASKKMNFTNYRRLKNKRQQNKRGTRKTKGGNKMSVREYFIKGMDKKSSLVKYPGYKGWVVRVAGKGKNTTALLSNGKDTPFVKRLSGRTDEVKLSEGVLDNLVRKGLAHTVKKYAFGRYKSILEDGITNMGDGKKSPREDRITADGETDKEGYDIKKIDRTITDDAVMDKAARRRRLLKAKLKKHRSLKNKKRNVRRKGLKSKRRFVSCDDPASLKKKKNLKKKKMVSRRKGLKLNKWNFVDANKVANKVLALYKKYEKFSDGDAKKAIATLFGDKQIKAEVAKLKITADDIIEMNTDQIDVPGLVEEVVNYYVEDMEMDPPAVAEEIVDVFVESDAPEEVIEEIKEEVADIAESVVDEGGEPAGDALDDIKDDVDDLKDELPPSLDEMGMEEVEVAAAKKAKQKVALYKTKLRRALKLTAKRQLMNIDPKGLFEIKAEICEGLITPNGKFAGIKEKVAVNVIEQSFRKILSTGALDKFIESAEKIVDLDDKAFAQIEEDIDGLLPFDVAGSSDDSSGSGSKDLMIQAKTGSGLFDGEKKVSAKEIRNALPSFGIK